MKLTTIKHKLNAFVLLGLLSSVTFAGSEFYEVGKSYLFVPRMDLVMKGTVSQLTDNEIVFVNRYILKASIAKAKQDSKNANATLAHNKNASAIIAYLKSDKKDALLEASPLKDIPTSYPRSQVTAVKLDN